MEASVSFDVLQRWLSRASPDQALQVVGCQLDDGKSEDLFGILGVDVLAQTLALDRGPSMSFRRIAGGAVIDPRPGRPLLAAIEGAKTSGERREVEVNAELRRRRLDPSRLGSSAACAQALAFVAAVENGECPTEDAFYEFYGAMTAAGSTTMYRRAAEVLQVLMTTCVRDGNAPQSLQWRLACVFRWIVNTDSV